MGAHLKTFEDVTLHRAFAHHLTAGGSGTIILSESCTEIANISPTLCALVSVFNFFLVSLLFVCAGHLSYSTLFTPVKLKHIILNKAGRDDLCMCAINFTNDSWQTD